jgi:RNA polymerase sigma-70 factor (ECF subfamily)
VVASHLQHIKRRCRRLLGSTADAEDVTQKVLLRAWKRLATYKGHGSFRGWILEIANRACWDALEQRRRWTRGEETGFLGSRDSSVSEGGGVSEKTPESELCAKQQRALAFARAVGGLTASQRAVFVARELLGLRADEAAAALGTSVPAINSALQRARAAILKMPRIKVSALGRDELQRLRRYTGAFEHSDLMALQTLLRDELTPAEAALLRFKPRRERETSSMSAPKAPRAAAAG